MTAPAARGEGDDTIVAMPFVDAKSIELIPHPSTPGGAVRALGVQLRAQGPDVLMLRYSLRAAMARLRVPPPRAGGAGARAQELWKHTCFEAFVAPLDAPGQDHRGRGYLEFNFSPSLDWEIHRFGSYRAGGSRALIGAPPTISLDRALDALELEATVRLSDVDGLRDMGHVRIGLAAVIEDDEGRLSYWALRHAPGKPDFHHSDAFALEVSLA